MSERVKNKLSTTVYLTEEQEKLIKKLVKRTKAPMATYIREGVDLVLKKYQDEMPGQGSLFE